MTRHPLHSTSAENGGLSPRDRLLDLLAQRVTDGLSPREDAELERLLTEYPDVGPDHFELAAAGASLAFAQDDARTGDAMPESLRRRLRGLVELTARQESAPLRIATPQPPHPVPTQTPRTTGSSGLTPQTRRISLAYLAAAAAVVLAAVGWWQALGPGRNPGGPAADPSASVAAAYADFVRTAPDLLRRPWAGKEPGYENVKGEVLWSDRLQRGYMLLAGLPSNDPSQKQYQLWIVDPARDKNPVDGGVFDVPPVPANDRCTSTGEVIVPIDTKLAVKDPAAFALTVEKPGGVVVSAGPLVVVAAR